MGLRPETWHFKGRMRDSGKKETERQQAPGERVRCQRRMKSAQDGVVNLIKWFRRGWQLERSQWIWRWEGHWQPRSSFQTKQLRQKRVPCTEYKSEQGKNPNRLRRLPKKFTVRGKETRQRNREMTGYKEEAFVCFWFCWLG